MCEDDLANAVQDKLKIALGAASFGAIRFQEDWLTKILASSAGTNSYLSMCWLTAVGGGWTTSIRMHESAFIFFRLRLDLIITIERKLFNQFF